MNKGFSIPPATLARVCYGALGRDFAGFGEAGPTSACRTNEDMLHADRPIPDSGIIRLRSLRQISTLHGRLVARSDSPVLSPLNQRIMRTAQIDLHETVIRSE